MNILKWCLPLLLLVSFHFNSGEGSTQFTINLKTRDSITAQDMFPLPHWVLADSFNCGEGSIISLFITFLVIYYSQI